MGFEVNNVQQVLRSFFRLVSSLWYMFHLSFLGAVVEAAEFEDKFFLGGGGNVTPKKILERGSGVHQNLTFLTVAPMVDWRPRIRRSHRNATVLILTCLIWRSDGSRMTHLFWCIGWIRVSIEKEVSILLQTHVLPAPPLPCPLCGVLPNAAPAQIQGHLPLHSPAVGA
jgi:hypothetical protein